MQIAIFIACCFIIGLLIVVCLELRRIRYDITHIQVNSGALMNMVIEYYFNILNAIPNTFEYNGNKGKVYRK